MEKISVEKTASRGIAVAKVLKYLQPDLTASAGMIADGQAEEEKGKFAAAKAAVMKELEALTSKNEIFAAHLEIAGDFALQDGVEAKISDEHKNVQLALQDTPTAFTITRNGGSYQIDADGKSLWCNGNGWIMNNGGKSLNLYQERILSYTYNVSNVGLGNLIAAAEAVGIEVPEFCTQAMHIQTAYTGVDRDAVKAQAMAAQAQINEASKTLYTLLGDVDISQKPNEITPGDVIQAILGFLFPAWFANS